MGSIQNFAYFETLFADFETPTIYKASVYPPKRVPAIP
jgi:hypothetical protein